MARNTSLALKSGGNRVGAGRRQWKCKPDVERGVPRGTTGKNVVPKSWLKL